MFVTSAIAAMAPWQPNVGLGPRRVPRLDQIHSWLLAGGIDLPVSARDFDSFLLRIEGRASLKQALRIVDAALSSSPDEGSVFAALPLNAWRQVCADRLALFSSSSLASGFATRDDSRSTELTREPDKACLSSEPRPKSGTTLAAMARDLGVPRRILKECAGRAGLLRWRLLAGRYVLDDWTDEEVKNLLAIYRRHYPNQTERGSLASLWRVLVREVGDLPNCGEVPAGAVPLDSSVSCSGVKRRGWPIALARVRAGHLRLYRRGPKDLLSSYWIEPAFFSEVDRLSKLKALDSAPGQLSIF